MKNEERVVTTKISREILDDVQTKCQYPSAQITDVPSYVVVERQFNGDEVIATKILYQGDKKKTAEIFEEYGFIPGSMVGLRYWKSDIEGDHLTDINSPSVFATMMSSVFTYHQLANFKMKLDKIKKRVLDLKDDISMMHYLKEDCIIETTHGDMILSVEFVPFEEHVIFHDTEYKINIRIWYKDDNMSVHQVVKFTPKIHLCWADYSEGLDKLVKAVFAVHELMELRCPEGARKEAMDDIMEFERHVDFCWHEPCLPVIVNGVYEIKC